MKLIHYFTRPLIITFLITNLFIAQFSPMWAMNAQKQLSPAQMEDLERELVEANRAIEEMVSQMSPQEQEEFNKAVEEATKMFENMSDEEFTKFLGEMFGEEAPGAPTEFNEPVSATTIQPEEMIERVQLTGEQKRKVDTLISIIDDIIRQTDLFLVQMQSSPELIQSITRWGSKGTISNWQSGADWDALKKDIEQFTQQLHKSEDQDITTKEYKYIFDLLADESLFNNLVHLQTTLNNLIPQIELPEFGVQKMSATTKTTIQEVLAAYTESLYLLTIPQTLNTIFEKYEPTAKKSREIEEATEKKAKEAAAKPRTPATATEAGFAPDTFGYGGYGYTPSYDYGYTPSYDYGSYGSGYGYPSSPMVEPESGEQAGSRSGRGGAGAPSTPSDKSEEDKNKDKDKNKEKEIKTNPDAERAINFKIDNDLDTINDLFSDNKELTTLDEYILDKSPLNDKAKKLVNDVLPQLDKLVKKLQKDISGEEGTGGLVSKIEKLDKTQQEYYKKVLQDTVKENKKALTKFEEVIKKIDYDNHKKDIIMEKQWAFFNDEILFKKASSMQQTDLQKDVPKPVDLREIQKDIRKLFAIVEQFPKKID